MFKLNHFLYLSLLTILPASPVLAQQRECITEAAQCFQINPLIIRSIIWNESRNKQGAYNVNDNKSVDVGVMQINSIHFKTFKAMGITSNTLKNNSCVNVFAGSWILNQEIHRFGYTWNGIGNYHSHTAVHHDRYVNDLLTAITHDLDKISAISIAYQDGVQEKFRCE